MSERKVKVPKRLLEKTIEEIKNAETFILDERGGPESPKLEETKGYTLAGELEGYIEE